MNDRLEYIKVKSKEITGIALNGNNNYIFGKGWMGTKLYEALQALGIPVNGFVVTKRLADEHFHLGLPVMEKQEVMLGYNKENIFVALRDQDMNLNSELSQYFENVVAINYPDDLTIIGTQYYINYLINTNIDIEDDCIKMQQFIFPNPFLKNFDYLLSWVYEAGDLLLPVLFHDFSRIDEGPYEIEEVALEPGDIVFDCGANIGLFTGIAAQKQCLVYAFEPMPDAINYLKEVEDMFPNNVKICPYALADTKKEAVFHVQNNDLLGASLLENHNSIDKEYKVTVDTIDNFVKMNQIEKVDFIKADIEGSERDMLLGAQETIRKHAPKISICTYHFIDDKEVLENIIKNIRQDYVIIHKWKKLYAYVPQ